MRQWYDDFCAIYPNESDRNVQLVYLAMVGIKPDEFVNKCKK